MSRTRKDRPFDVKMKELEADPLTVEVPYLFGFNRSRSLASHPTQSYTRVFLKADTKAIAEYRESLSEIDGKIVETEGKIDLHEFWAVNHVEENPNVDCPHPKGLVQVRGSGTTFKQFADMWPIVKSTYNLTPACGVFMKKTERKYIKIEVFQYYSSEVQEDSYPEYSHADFGYPTPPKSNKFEHKRRAETRSKLRELRDSTDVEKDFDESDLISKPVISYRDRI